MLTRRKQHVLVCRSGKPETPERRETQWSEEGVKWRVSMATAFCFFLLSLFFFLKSIWWLRREGKWIPCGVYLFVAVAQFSENHYLNAHVCLCVCVPKHVCVRVCVCFLSCAPLCSTEATFTVYASFPFRFNKINTPKLAGSELYFVLFFFCLPNQYSSQRKQQKHKLRVSVSLQF